MLVISAPATAPAISVTISALTSTSISVKPCCARRAVSESSRHARWIDRKPAALENRARTPTIVGGLT